MSFSGIIVRRPLTIPNIRALPRSQAYVSQFRSYRELDRSPWRPGSTNSHSFLRLGLFLCPGIPVTLLPS
jgi:hypothetical protein